jgi:hypothetical protein
MEVVSTSVSKFLIQGGGEKHLRDGRKVLLREGKAKTPCVLIKPIRDFTEFSDLPRFMRSQIVENKAVLTSSFILLSRHGETLGHAVPADPNENYTSPSGDEPAPSSEPVATDMQQRAAQLDALKAEIAALERHKAAKEAEMREVALRLAEDLRDILK